MIGPDCSVVVPSFNRCERLEMVLRGLERQTLPVSRFEVLIVLDGSTDGSASMLSGWQAARRLPNLHWVRQPRSGQAAARNTGVKLTAAPVLVFLDDDVVPEPELVDGHLRWHREGLPRAVLGDCRMVQRSSGGMYHQLAWAWWEDKYHRRALPGRQPGYRDFCAGNVSLRREDFLRVGGFDPAFTGYGGEDYELGYRLLRAGVQFVSDRAIQARHHHAITVVGVLRATRQEALGDVILGRKHPELRAGLRMTRVLSGRYGLLVRLAFRAPVLGDRLMACLQLALPLLERYKMRRRWFRCFDHLRSYAYWRGVRDALGSWQALLAYQAGSEAPPRHTLAIDAGLPAELPALWVDGPSQVSVTWLGRELGTLLLEEAVEEPLRPYLARQIAGQLGPRLWAAVAAPGAPLSTLRAVGAGWQELPSNVSDLQEVAL